MIGEIFGAVIIMRSAGLTAIIGIIVILNSRCSADIVYDFSSGPILWDPSGGPVTWDTTGDAIDDFQIFVTEGTIDSGSGLYVIDNYSTSSGGIIKTFTFSISAINPAMDKCEFNNLGFDFYSEKNIEPGGSGGAGAVTIDVFDDRGNEIGNGINVTGNLGSTPTNVVLPGLIPTEWLMIAVDIDSAPNNDDAQVLLGDFVINGGTVRCFTSTPEPGIVPFLLVQLAVMISSCRRRRRRD